MKNLIKLNKWHVALIAVGILLIVELILILYIYVPRQYQNEYFSIPTPVEVQKVFDVETGVYYYITSTGDIEVAVDIYGRPLIVDGSDGTAAVDPMRGANPMKEQ